MRIGSLNRSPTVLLSAVNTLQAKHLMEELELTRHLLEMVVRYPRMQVTGAYPGLHHNQLFQAEYNHQEDDNTYTNYNQVHTVSRSVRSDSVPRVHYGLIALGNQVIRDGVTQEKITTRAQRVML